MDFTAKSSLASAATAVWAWSTPTLSADALAPRLTGIVVGPQSREAVFVDPADARGVVVLQEGAVIGRFSIKSISSWTVVVAGPSGDQTLALGEGHDVSARQVSIAAESSSQAGNMKAETTKAGMTIGLLALQRDRCARAGLLPNVHADAEKRLTGAIVAMSELPPREGVEAERNAPTAMLASALSAGLAEARRKGLADIPDSAGCLRLDARWRASAGRYGAL